MPYRCSPAFGMHSAAAERRPCPFVAKERLVRCPNMCFDCAPDKTEQLQAVLTLCLFAAYIGCTPPPPCASTAVSKHGDPSDRCFPDFQRRLRKGEGGVLCSTSFQMSCQGLAVVEGGFSENERVVSYNISGYPAAPVCTPPPPTTTLGQSPVRGGEAFSFSHTYFHHLSLPLLFVVVCLRGPFEWLQSSSSWQVAVLNKISPPKGNAVHAVHTQCEVLDVGKY